MLFDAVLAIASFLQSADPSVSIIQVMDRTVLAKASHAQEKFWRRIGTYIDKHHLPPNKIDPNLIANDTELKITFPYIDGEIPLPNGKSYDFYFEYPQVSGLVDEIVQNQINQVLKDELIGDEENPKLFEYDEECLNGDLHNSPNG